ncbi:MAG: hypothetical protein ABL958_00945 [Bdellovibrionia bacterium]
MSQSPAIQNLRPFFSVVLIIITMLTVVFFKMEVRRVGYSLLRISRAEKAAADENRVQNIAFSRLTRPGRIENLAQTRLALTKAGQGQVLQVAGNVLIAQ